MRQLLLLLWGLILFVGCGKLPINGDLDGQWQIQEIRYTDGRVETPERAYYCVQLHSAPEPYAFYQAVPVYRLHDGLPECFVCEPF